MKNKILYFLVLGLMKAYLRLNEVLTLNSWVFLFGVRKSCNTILAIFIFLRFYLQSFQKRAAEMS
jgi:hypothetical protein